MNRIEELISKCVSGNAPRDIIKEIEDEFPDVSTVRLSILKDLRCSGVRMHSKDIVVEGSSVKINSDDSSGNLQVIVDTYSRIYPEIEFLISS